MIDAEAVAAEIRRFAGAPSDAVVSMDDLSRACGFTVTRVLMLTEADSWFNDRAGRIRVRLDVMDERARWLVGHELAEWWLRGVVFPSLVERERACDAIGAALVAPRAAFASAIHVLDHSVSALAAAFHVPMSLALLRVGEITGRPVRLLGPRQRTRGRTIASWDRAHPIALKDEGRWGLMERR